MAASNTPGSLRRPVPQPPWNENNPMRPGKTLEDKRTGAHASKHERNDRQATYREIADSTHPKRF